MLLFFINTKLSQKSYDNINFPEILLILFIFSFQNSDLKYDQQAIFMVTFRITQTVNRQDDT